MTLNALQRSDYPFWDKCYWRHFRIKQRYLVLFAEHTLKEKENLFISREREKQSFSLPNFQQLKKLGSLIGSFLLTFPIITQNSQELILEQRQRQRQRQRQTVKCFYDTETDTKGEKEVENERMRKNKSVIIKREKRLQNQINRERGRHKTGKRFGEGERDNERNKEKEVYIQIYFKVNIQRYRTVLDLEVICSKFSSIRIHYCCQESNCTARRAMGSVYFCTAFNVYWLKYSLTHMHQRRESLLFDIEQSNRCWSVQKSISFGQRALLKEMVQFFLF